MTPRFQSNNQWGLYNWANPGKDIHAPQAWEMNTGRSDVIIAVIDGGVDYTHSDLDPGNRSRIIQGYDVADNDSKPNGRHPFTVWIRQSWDSCSRYYWCDYRQ